MNLTGTTRTQSKVDPSVWFTVKSLNLIQRSKRDMPILKERDDYRRAIQAKLDLLKQILGPDESERYQIEEEKAAYTKARWAKLEAATPDQRSTVDAHLDKELALLHGSIMPAVLKASLTNIEGLQFEGKQVLEIPDFLEKASDVLLMEAYDLCEAASGLSGEQVKN